MVDIDSIPVVEVMCAYSVTNVFLKYGWTISCKDKNAVMKLKLQEIEKY